MVSRYRNTAASRLADLYMVPLSDKGRRLLMIAAVHNAFFDESGTHDGSEIVAMGGLVSSYDNWSRWEVEWNNILRARGIKVFHFSEFMARKESLTTNGPIFSATILWKDYAQPYPTIL